MNAGEQFVWGCRDERKRLEKQTIQLTDGAPAVAPCDTAISGAPDSAILLCVCEYQSCFHLDQK
jgi:hypothetical protein